MKNKGLVVIRIVILLLIVCGIRGCIKHDQKVNRNIPVITDADRVSDKPIESITEFTNDNQRELEKALNVFSGEWNKKLNSKEPLKAYISKPYIMSDGSVQLDCNIVRNGVSIRNMEIIRDNGNYIFSEKYKSKVRHDHSVSEEDFLALRYFAKENYTGVIFQTQSPMYRMKNNLKGKKELALLAIKALDNLVDDYVSIRVKKIEVYKNYDIMVGNIVTDREPVVFIQAIFQPACKQGELKSEDMAYEINISYDILGDIKDTAKEKEIEAFMAPFLDDLDQTSRTMCEYNNSLEELSYESITKGQEFSIVEEWTAE